MKTIKVNGKDWEEVPYDVCLKREVANYLSLDGKHYIPKKETPSLGELSEEYEKNNISLKVNPTQYKKIHAIRDMLIVADYVNKGMGEEDSYWCEFYLNDGEVRWIDTGGNAYSFIRFHPDKIEPAREILSDETIKRALL